MKKVRHKVCPTNKTIITFLVAPKIQGSVSTQAPKKYKTRTKEFGGEIFVLRPEAVQKYSQREKTEIKNGILIIQGKTEFSDPITLYTVERKKERHRGTSPIKLIPFLVSPKILVRGLIADLLPTLKGCCKLLRNVNLSLLGLKHGAGKIRSDRTVCAKTAGHSLPGGEGAAGCKCVYLDTLLSAHYVERADGCSLGGNVCDITGLTEGSVEGVLHDGHGVKSYDLSGLVEPLLDVAGADELRNGINKCHVACPSGRGGSDVRAGALSDIVDDLGVILDVSVGGEMNILHRHTKLLIDLVVEILDHRVSEACLVGDRSDVAVLISPLVLCNEVNLGAVNLEVVDKLCKGDVGVGLRVTEDHSKALACLGSCLKSGEEGGNKHGVRVHHNLNLELGMPPSLSLLKVLAAEATNVLAYLLILEGHEFVRLENPSP